MMFDCDADVCPNVVAMAGSHSRLERFCTHTAGVWKLFDMQLLSDVAITGSNVTTCQTLQVISPAPQPIL